MADSPLREPLMCCEVVWRHRNDTISRFQVRDHSSDFGNEASTLARARCILGVDLST